MPSERPKYAVPWRTREYVDVTARARELGCDAPSGVALLPGNFASAASRAKFRYHAVVPQVRQAWRGIGLIDSGPGRRLSSTTEASADKSDQQVPIAVFFGMNLPSASRQPVLYALSMVASVLTANPFLSRAREVRVDAIVERPTSCVCIEYHGDAGELVALAKSVHEIRDSDASTCPTAKEAGAVL